MTGGLGRGPDHRFSWRDAVAGVTVALVAIPQGMAYAELAGLPGHHGLYAVALPPIAAAFFASSPFLQTGPVATTALLTFGALVPLAPVGSGAFVALAAMLALVVGVVRTALGLLRMGWVSYLMSRPVLEGFMTGAAFLIVSSQLPGLTGVSAAGGGVLARAAWTLAHPRLWDPQAVAVGLGTVAVIVLGRRIHPRVPGAMIAAVLGIGASTLLGFGGPVIGMVPEGLPPVTLALPWQRLPSLVLPGIVIALVGFAEAASISRAFATEARMRWEPNREFISQGAANLAAGLSGGFPVGGSFARSSLNRMAGATSRWAGLVTGLAVLLFLPFAGVLGDLPRAVLAGIVVTAVWKMLRPQRLLALWKLSRVQALVGWSTLALTVLLAPHVEQAVIIGVLLAGGVHLWRELDPRVQAHREGDTLHLHPSGVLWFASAPIVDDAVLDHLAAEPDVRMVVLHLDGLGRVDLTGAMALTEMLGLLRDAGLEVRVEGVPPHARRVLAAAMDDESNAASGPSARDDEGVN